MPALRDSGTSHGCMIKIVCEAAEVIYEWTKPSGKQSPMQQIQPISVHTVCSVGSLPWNGAFWSFAVYRLGGGGLLLLLLVRLLLLDRLLV